LKQNSLQVLIRAPFFFFPCPQALSSTPEEYDSPLRTLSRSGDSDRTPSESIPRLRRRSLSFFSSFDSPSGLLPSVRGDLPASPSALSLSSFLNVYFHGSLDRICSFIGPFFAPWVRFSRLPFSVSPNRSLRLFPPASPCTGLFLLSPLLSVN